MRRVIAEPMAAWRMRWVIPICAVIATSLLLLLAARQESQHQRQFHQDLPEASHIDYAYSAPARIVALIVGGPGVLLASRGFQFVGFVFGIAAVLLSWHGLLFFIRRRAILKGDGVRGRVILYCCIAVIAAVAGVHALAEFFTDIRSLGGPLFWHVVRSYGLATVLWMNCGVALWMFVIAALMIRVLIDGMAGSARSDSRTTSVS